MFQAISTAKKQDLRHRATFSALLKCWEKSQMSRNNTDPSGDNLSLRDSGWDLLCSHKIKFTFYSSQLIVICNEHLGGNIFAPFKAKVVRQSPRSTTLFSLISLTLNSQVLILVLFDIEMKWKLKKYSFMSSFIFTFSRCNYNYAITTSFKPSRSWLILDKGSNYQMIV